MDLFKLFFNHDQRLDKLQKRNANKTPKEVEATLDDFMRPTPTFSKFYLTGTRLQDQTFGLSKLEKYTQIVEKLDTIFGANLIKSANGAFNKLSEALNETPVGPAIIIAGQTEITFDIKPLAVDDESNVGHLKDELRVALLAGHKVLYKEKAQNGFDLHLFSSKNIYPDLFSPLQTLIDDNFRFFSINSKRMRTERHFYFETWTLENPPHGAEEVFPETILKSK